MQQSEQPATTSSNEQIHLETETAQNEQVDEAASGAGETYKEPSAPALPARPRTQGPGGINWFAVAVVILIAAIFAAAARLNAQPATSLAPIAVLSATGCGLLLTGLRKLHTVRGAGLLEAAMGGLFLALFQFIAALSYPGVVPTLGNDQIMRTGFLTTWGLIFCFAIVFSMAGAALGHLAFAPLRPAPARPAPAQEETAGTVEEDLQADDGEEAEPPGETSDDENPEADEQEVAAGTWSAAIGPPQPRSVLSYVIAILLLGLAPTLVGYVFAAAYDYALYLNQFSPGPYPTLRLLSALLPWQVPLPITLNAFTAHLIIFTLLWRIPLFLGNPSIFDFQSLEPLIYNATGLSLLLLTAQRQETSLQLTGSRRRWWLYLFLAALLGLALVLPADLWIVRGLRGLLQLGNFVVPLRILSILNPLTFSLNLVTGPLICMGTLLLLSRLFRRQPQTS